MTNIIFYIEIKKRLYWIIKAPFIINKKLLFSLSLILYVFFINIYQRSLPFSSDYALGLTSPYNRAIHRQDDHGSLTS